MDHQHTHACLLRIGPASIRPKSVAEFQHCTLHPESVIRNFHCELSPSFGVPTLSLVCTSRGLPCGRCCYTCQRQAHGGTVPHGDEVNSGPPRGLLYLQQNLGGRFLRLDFGTREVCPLFTFLLNVSFTHAQ